MNIYDIIDIFNCSFEEIENTDAQTIRYRVRISTILYDLRIHNHARQRSESLSRRECIYNPCREGHGALSEKSENPIPRSIPPR